MRVFNHLIYEYRKGVRDLILYTLPAHCEECVKRKLEKNGINFKIQRLSNGNFNLFFGKDECLMVVDKVCLGKPLNLLTPEEDFILGILLGYSISEQCSRYCKKQNIRNNISCLV